MEMTDPTPTRAEVTVARYNAAGYDPGMTAAHEGPWVSFTDYQSLRERAEAAEAAEAGSSELHRQLHNMTEAARDWMAKAERKAELVDACAHAARNTTDVEETLIANVFALTAKNQALRKMAAAAWNDAIEAAADVVDEQHWSKGGISDAAHEAMADRIRALRRAAPTGVEA